MAGVAAKFTGAGYLDYGSTPPIASSVPFAIALYEKTDALTTYASLCGIPTSTGQFIWIRSAQDGYHCAIGGAGGTPSAFVTGAQVVGEVHRFLLTGDSMASTATHRLWRDGIEITRGTTAFGATTAKQLYIGWDGQDAKWNGLIQDFNLWGRKFSDADVKDYFSNPYAHFKPTSRTLWIPGTVSAGGATTVTSDASAAYALRGSVSQDASAAYALRGSVTSDATPSYYIRGVTQTDASAAYSIQGAVQTDAPASYTITGSVQSDAATAYLLRTSAQADASAAYALRSVVSADATAAFAILNDGVVTSDTLAAYQVRGLVQTDAPAGYSVRSALLADASCAYHVRGGVYADASASYAVLATTVVWADAVAGYFVDGITLATIPGALASGRPSSTQYNSRPARLQTSTRPAR